MFRTALATFDESAEPMAVKVTESLVIEIPFGISTWTLISTPAPGANGPTLPGPFVVQALPLYVKLKLSLVLLVLVTRNV